MSKLESTTRQQLIIRAVKKKPRSFKDLKNHIEKEFGILNLAFNMGVKTFQRDIKEILSFYGVEILYNRPANEYFIENDIDQATERIFESYETTNALKLSEGLSKYILFEKYKFSGTLHLHSLLYAIKNRYVIKFSHQKYFENITNRTAQPLALKEFKNRWYLIVRDTDKQHIASFGLDRIIDIEITDQKFKYPTGYKLEDTFKYAFGIMTNENKEPSIVVLSFTPYQGKFIKSLPLHSTQQIITDNGTELRIKLTIHITHDFIMELLSLGNSVKVIKPGSLVNNCKRIYQAALSQYK